MPCLTRRRRRRTFLPLISRTDDRPAPGCSKIGSQLKLPPRLEQARYEIEQAFTTISYFRFCFNASAPERGIKQENLL
ncbi:MAG TPA: hypothetical protein VF844_18375 [Ktedonobacteraceae bacterium]